MSAILVLLLAAPMPLQQLPWAEFARETERGMETVSIYSLPNSGSKRMEFRLSYSLRMTDDDRNASTTSAVCPVARAVIGSMRDLKMPRFAPDGMNVDRRNGARDLTRYVLRAPTNLKNGSATISAGDGTPLATWIDKAFNALSACWRRSG